MPAQKKPDQQAATKRLGDTFKVHAGTIARGAVAHISRSRASSANVIAITKIYDNGSRIEESTGNETKGKTFNLGADLIRLRERTSFKCTPPGIMKCYLSVQK